MFKTNHTNFTLSTLFNSVSISPYWESLINNFPQEYINNVWEEEGDGEEAVRCILSIIQNNYKNLLVVNIEDGEILLDIPLIKTNLDKTLEEILQENQITGPNLGLSV